MRPDYHELDVTKVVLITGAVGFIGFHLAKKLLEQGVKVIGYDNINEYYDVSLKISRLDILIKYTNFTFIKGDLANKQDVNKLFRDFKPQIVVNLAAQAGVRYSIDNPEVYINSNIIGFYHILEACRHNPVEHLVFASSSSVYGANKKVPFSTEDKTETPVSLYAATKKSNELLAYSYCNLYRIPVTGLRFFTVYGPYGRPDMAYFSFTKAILEDKSIQVFNHGDMYRDFTYIDDVVKAIEKILCNSPSRNQDNMQYMIYNIGNNKPEKLIYFIETLENCIGKKAKIEYIPMQAGDVYRTYADISDLVEDFEYAPNTSIEIGLYNFIKWYRDYYNI